MFVKSRTHSPSCDGLSLIGGETVAGPAEIGIMCCCGDLAKISELK